ncbi:MAG: expansin EXLX1 family cellulose-binding protein [Lachnospiraceae bacterium]
MKKQMMVYGMVVFMLLGLWGNVQSVEAKTRLNKTKVTLTVGKSVTLKMKGTTKKPKWTTSNKKIATVSKVGKVKAKKAGKVTITAKIGKKKYCCQITVKNVSKNTTEETASEENKTTEEEKANEEKTTEEKTTEEQGSTPSDSTSSADAGEYSIDNVHSGEGTYYDRTSGGAANLDYMEASYYTAAMNNEDYMNGLAGAYIEITDKDGDKINVVITDRLPEGKKGDIDLTRTSFEQIEPLVTGRMNITWKIIPLPTTEPIQYVFKPTSTQYWAEVQVRNHRYPIKKLEYFDSATNSYVELPRQEYNYFTAASGMGEGPYTFRVTDFYGHVLVDTGISINSTETPINGAANFPY